MIVAAMGATGMRQLSMYQPLRQVARAWHCAATGGQLANGN